MDNCDYKATANKASKLDQYPILTFEDLITKLGKGLDTTSWTCNLHTPRLSWRQRVESLWWSTPTKVCFSTNASPVVFPVHQLSSRGLWGPCFRAYSQLLSTLMTFLWQEIRQLSHFRIWVKSSRGWIRQERGWRRRSVLLVQGKLCSFATVSTGSGLNHWMRRWRLWFKQNCQKTSSSWRHIWGSWTIMGIFWETCQKNCIPCTNCCKRESGRSMV